MKKNMFLAGLLTFSALAVALVGVVAKFVLLEPLGLNLQENVVALPFILLRDDSLRYVITDLRQNCGSDEAMQPTEATQSTDPTQPTEPVEQRPTEVVLPKENLLEKVLFIGDSRTCGLRDHARLEGADYFCEVGMSVFNVSQKQLSDQNYQKETLSSLLAQREYSCVVINLGLNEAGYPLNSLLRAYRELLDEVVRTQPQSTIVLQGILTVGRRWAQKSPYTAPENLQVVNWEIQGLAEEYQLCYVDANERFADESGYLPDDLSADGCHLYAKYTSIWADWICQTLEDLDR